MSVILSKRGLLGRYSIRHWVFCRLDRRWVTGLHASWAAGLGSWVMDWVRPRSNESFFLTRLSAILRCRFLSPLHDGSQHRFFVLFLPLLLPLPLCLLILLSPTKFRGCWTSREADLGSPKIRFLGSFSDGGDDSYMASIFFGVEVLRPVRTFQCDLLNIGVGADVF